MRPQLFSPGVALGLEDGAALAALITSVAASPTAAAGGGGGISASAGTGQQARSQLEACLEAFDRQRRPQVCC
jgi:hypothetical protein